MTDPLKSMRKVLENALRKARMDGWEQGKKQVETPTKYTLSDQTKLKAIHQEALEKLTTIVKDSNNALINELLGEAEEYDVTDLERLQHETGELLEAVPTSTIKAKLQEGKDE